MRTKTENLAASKHNFEGGSIFHDLRFWNLLFIGATAALFIGYLAMTTSSASQGFNLRSLQKKVTELQGQSQRAEVASLGSRSMESVDAAVRGLGFVPIEDVDYLGAGAGMVARR